MNLCISSIDPAMTIRKTIRTAGAFCLLSSVLLGVIPAFPADDEEYNPIMDSELSPSIQQPSGDRSFDKLVSLDLRDMDIVEALRFVSAKSGVNIVTTKDVMGRVTVKLEDVALRDVFDLLLRLNRLAYVEQAGIYQVMTEQEYKAIYGRNFNDTRIVKVLRLKYAVPEQIFNMLDAMKTEIGRVLVDQESGNVLLMDIPEQIVEMEKAMNAFEEENIIEVFTLKYARAKDVEDMLKTRLDARKVGTVKSDERNNQVVVQTFANRMEEIRQLVAKLDKPTKQVLIETKIIKIRLTNQLDSGVEWEGIGRISQQFGPTYLGSYPFSYMTAGESSPVFQTREDYYDSLEQQIGAYPFSGTTGSLSASTKTVLGENMHLGVFSEKLDFDLLVNFLNTLGESRVLANPKIAVVNNQEAKIHIGERQAYVTTTTTSGQTTSTIAEEVSFVDVGIQLSVTPTINDDGFVTMKIKPEISNVGSTLITPTNNRIPIIDTTLTETTVMMKDNTTLMIGGLRKEEKTGDSTQFPWLGDLPVIGFFFKRATDKLERTEILVMITPHIVTGEELTTGAPQEFEGGLIKEEVPYQPLTPAASELPQTTPSPPIQPKPYRDYMELDLPSAQDFLAKGLKNGADEELSR